MGDLIIVSNKAHVKLQSPKSNNYGKLRLMPRIEIHHNEVETQTLYQRSYLNDTLLLEIERDYNEIRSLLSRTDGNISTNLAETFTKSHSKATICVRGQETVLRFISNVSLLFAKKDQETATALLND